MSIAPVTASITTPSELSVERRSAMLYSGLNRIGWVAAALVLVCGLLAGGAFYAVLSGALNSAVTSNFQKSVDGFERQINIGTSQIEQVLHTSAAWARTGTLRIEDPATFNRIMGPVIAVRPLLSSVHLATDAGKELLLLRLPDGWKNRLTNVPVNGTRQQWLDWKDPVTQVGTQWKEQDYDPRTRPWFQGVSGTAENLAYWTEPYVFASTKDPGITVSLRWRDASSGQTQVMAFDVLLTEISRLTSRLDYGQQGYVVLLTRDGKILGLPRGQGFDSDEAIRAAVMQEPGKLGLTAIAAAHQEFSEHPDAGATRTLSAQQVGAREDWVVTRRPIRFGTQEFSLLALAPKSDLMPWANTLLTVLGGIAVLCAMIGITLSRRITRTISVPIQQVFTDLDTSNRTLNAQISRAAVMTALAPKLQTADSFEELGRSLLDGLAAHLPIGQASLYRADLTTETLWLCNGYARSNEASSPARIAFAEGLTGQCARERQSIALAEPGPAHGQIVSALASEPPAALHLFPVCNHDSLVGVIEFLLLRKFTAAELALIESLLPLLALCMEVIKRNQLTRTLLDESRHQAARIETLLGEQNTIFDKAPMGILYVANGLVQRANDQCTALFNRERDDIVGSEIAALFPDAQNYQRFNQTASEQLAAGESVRLEWEWGVGSGRWLMIAIQRIPAAGKVLAAIWSVEDISERKRLETAMQENETRLQRILEDSPAAVIMVTEEGDQIFSNERLVEMLKLSRSLMVGKRSSEFWANPADRVPFLARLQAEGFVKDYEARFRRADGKLISVLLNTRWLEQGGKRLLLTWIYEITERQQAGESLSEAHEENVMTASPQVGAGNTAMDAEDPA